MDNRPGIAAFSWNDISQLIDPMTWYPTPNGLLVFGAMAIVVSASCIAIFIMGWRR